MNNFKLRSSYRATTDQMNAVNSLLYGLKNGINKQVLLGVTGSGKTFTVANIIQKLNQPVLIISHNKTLAGQLYQEFKSFFPENAVSYFVSYYDYYQPEAYIPSTDTYIEKDADINEMIDKLRLAATTNIMTRSDTIVVASVSCIYNIGHPMEYEKFSAVLFEGQIISRKQIAEKLVELQYEKSEFGFHRGTFRIRGNNLDIYPAYEEKAFRLIFDENKIINIELINPITGAKEKNEQYKRRIIIFPAKHFMSDQTKNMQIFLKIKRDLKEQIELFNKQGKTIEAYRINQRVNYDLEMINELGYVKGIENYARYFDGRKPGEAPYSLIDFFNYKYKKNWLCIIDESHMTFPQIRGMYQGDLSRKNTLIDYGFRLPASLDNRPLKFTEFLKKIPNFIATSATPSLWEIKQADISAQRNKGVYEYHGLTQQLLRPTGIPDPEVTMKPLANQVDDVIREINIQIKKRQRTLVTTLTKQTAEDLSNYLSERNIKVSYLHSDVDTLERTDILDNLRKGNFDVVIGINLLREGLDLPEVSLVAILDADKEGFLRSETSLIQTMGRAARHVEGRVILYADKLTESIKRALAEVERRRKWQLDYNRKNHIIPKSIKKPIRENIVDTDSYNKIENIINNRYEDSKKLNEISFESLTPVDKKHLVNKLRQEMKIAAADLNFELAIRIRDKIRDLTN